VHGGVRTRQGILGCCEVGVGTHVHIAFGSRVLSLGRKMDYQHEDKIRAGNAQGWKYSNLMIKLLTIIEEGQCMRILMLGMFTWVLMVLARRPSGCKTWRVERQVAMCKYLRRNGWGGRMHNARLDVVYCGPCRHCRALTRGEKGHQRDIYEARDLSRKKRLLAVDWQPGPFPT